MQTSHIETWFRTNLWATRILALLDWKVEGSTCRGQINWRRNRIGMWTRTNKICTRQILTLCYSFISDSSLRCDNSFIFRRRKSKFTRNRSLLPWLMTLRTPTASRSTITTAITVSTRSTSARSQRRFPFKLHPWKGSDWAAVNQDLLRRKLHRAPRVRMSEMARKSQDKKIRTTTSNGAQSNTRSSTKPSRCTRTINSATSASQGSWNRPPTWRSTQARSGSKSSNTNKWGERKSGKR